MPFQLRSEFEPQGDQPQAIDSIVRSLDEGAKDQVLLGITGSGKSLPPDERVLIGLEKDGEIKSSLIPIGELIDGVLSRHKTFLTEDKNEIVWAEQLSERYHAFAFDPETKQSAWKPITAYLRHPAPETLFRVQTTCGRLVTTTGDHNFFVLRDGCLQLLETKDIQTGDYLPLPLFLPSPDVPLESVSIAETLKDEKVYLQVPPALLPQLDLPRDKRWRVAHSGENVLLASVPLDLAKDLQLKGKRQSFPAELKLTDDWLALIGAYIAEGHSTKRFCLISAQESGWHERVKEILANLNLTFGVRLRGDFQVSSMLLTKTLSNWCGRTAFKKRLPPFWTELSNRQLSKILATYFAGDGGVEAEGVFCTTASKTLADDLLWALQRFGIWARTRFRKIKKPDGSPSSCWTISITGRDNLERFADCIGFDYEAKQKRLDQLLARLRATACNTNVDLVPVSGAQIKELRTRRGWFQSDLAAALKVGQSLISMFESEQRRPSRQLWQRLMSLLDSEADSLIEQLASLLNCRWTQIKKVEETLPETPFVYDLSVADWETFAAGFGGLFVHNTFSIATVIQRTQRPALVLAHNKTLAAQLYQEFKSFFPENSVEYFVSYYDYYQPEAYVPASDMYIEKEATINEEIDRLRMSATRALFENRHVIVVASVSCIYGLGDPDAYYGMLLFLEPGGKMTRDALLQKLVELQYERSDVDFNRGSFRVRGDVVEIYPSYQEQAYRVELWGDEIDSISTIDPLLGEVIHKHTSRVPIYPKTHYVMSKQTIKGALKSIREELDWWEPKLIAEGKLVEAQRLHQRTMYDLEMIKEMGFCRGIENYSRHLTGKPPGSPPPTLLDYLPKDSIMVIDESHQTIPQIGGMFKGDQSRKRTLVEYGFRLPSAMDNRPLNFEEFEGRIGQTIYVSATPGKYELMKTGGEVVEQIIRPTGLLDPVVEVRPVKGQIDNLLEECRLRTERNERVLVTTLTKKMSEDLTEYFAEVGVKVRYLHSDIETLERIKILRDLRRGEFDVLVGINLLREGLDLPEVSLVAILDADKEGFLRSDRSLIQTMGRAARNASGTAILYADRVTDSMRRAIEETTRRRSIQEEYNTEHNITPQTIIKSIEATLVTAYEADYFKVPLNLDAIEDYTSDNIKQTIARLEAEMRESARRFEFERAAELRDRVKYLRERQLQLT